MKTTFWELALIGCLAVVFCGCPTQPPPQKDPEQEGDRAFQDGDYGRAAGLYQQAAARAGAGEEERARANFKLGLSRFCAGELAEAEEALTRAQEHYAYAVSGLIYLAEVRLAAGRYKQVEDTKELDVLLDTHPATVSNIRGRVLFAQAAAEKDAEARKELYGKAAETFKEALKSADQEGLHERGRAIVLRNLAIAYYKQGSYWEAEDRFREYMAGLESQGAAPIDPDSAFYEGLFAYGTLHTQVVKAKWGDQAEEISPAHQEVLRKVLSPEEQKEFGLSE